MIARAKALLEELDKDDADILVPTVVVGEFLAGVQRARSSALPPRLRIVEPRPDERYIKCVPFVPLKAAAGAFSDLQHIDEDDWQRHRRWYYTGWPRGGKSARRSASLSATSPSRCIVCVGNANESPRASTARMIARFSRCRSRMYF